MSPSKAKEHQRTLISLIMSFVLALSFVPNIALAEVSSGNSQAPDNVQSIEQVESQANDNASASLTAGATAELFAQADVEKPRDISVTVGLPSESNVNQDLYVDLTYNDKFFEQPSKTYNDDLAYASTCLAAAADNSNEGGNNYKLKSKNIVSFLQDIGCSDVTINGGYNAKPMQEANIGVAIGYKDILVNDKKYRLFVFGVRGGGYEEEWAVNMRVGAEGDATGFQEARDAALGFIMPYIKKHTDGLTGDVNVKVWGSGYCRGGTTTNMVFGWLNKWIYERNNGSSYKAYTQSYNQEHSVYGASYSATDRRYTEKVSFSPNKTDGYLASNVTITNDDLYAYPVNCPFGADKTDVENHEPLMTGIHNLINPDDWFPQVVMDWWGFKRYGYTQDHDITGTYATDGSLHNRNLSVWDPTNATRKAAVNDMISKLKAVDPHTAFNSTFFRQHYFSKASVVKNTVVKIGSWLWNRLGGSRIVKLEEPDIFQISIDEKGEGNQFVSKNAELKYNQGAYYQEFMKFFLNSAGFPDDPAKARKHYVDNYQDAMVDLMYWVCGQPLDVREKFSKVASSQVKKSFKQMQDEGVAELNKKNPILGKVGSILNTSVGTWISYITAALWSVNDSSASVPSALINRTLKNTFNELKVPYTQAQLDRASSVIAKLAYNYYSKEQDIARFCFFHSLTMYKAGSSIAQSHWPEQSLAWFKQCKPGSASKKSKDNVNTQVQTQSSALTAEPSTGLATQSLGTQGELTAHEVYAYFDDDPDMLYDQGETVDGEILGVLDISDKYNAENVVITSWNMYDFSDFTQGKPALKTVDLGYEMQASDPEFIMLTPNSVTLGSKHVNLWLNKAMTGFDQDTLIGSFDLYDGGYYYIAQTALPEGVSADGFDVLYYGDNENLLNREGVVLDGWVSAADEEGNLVGFLPDDFVDYSELPEGDTVDLYAVWLDPVAYGVTYHANRSQDDSYMVEAAQFSDDGNTLVIQGLAGNDEGMQNPGKVFVGWNTAPDGSGQTIEVGKGATLEQLGLGTRTQYLQELDQLATLEVQETPTHYVEPEGDASSAAEELEAELEAKYTVHLYAQWADPATWTRLSGDNAYGTMAQVVNEGWTASDTVVIAAFDGYWDALAASALAGSEGAPVLLTGRDSLQPETASLIKSLGAKKAYICGEKEAISKDVEDEIAGMGLTVERFGGDMAFNTAEKISARAKLNRGADCDTCVIATIDGFYDSLSVAPAAYSLGMPVYLTGWDLMLADSTVKAIKDAGYTKAIIVGGKDAVKEGKDGVEGQLSLGTSVKTFTRLAGDNAWQTSEAIAEWGLGAGLTAETVGVADGNGYWDALTGAPLVGLKNGSLVLVPHDGMSSDNKWYFSYDPYCIEHFIKGNAAAIRQGYVFGGEAAVPKQAFDACVAATEGVVSNNETEIGA